MLMKDAIFPKLFSIYIFEKRNSFASRALMSIHDNPPRVRGRAKISEAVGRGVQIRVGLTCNHGYS